MKFKRPPNEQLQNCDFSKIHVESSVNRIMYGFLKYEVNIIERRNVKQRIFVQPVFSKKKTKKNTLFLQTQQKKNLTIQKKQKNNKNKKKTTRI